MIRANIRSQGAKAIIPWKGLWLPPDKAFRAFESEEAEALYTQRHFIERLFGKIKENKRVATRFDKLDYTFLSFIALALMLAFQLLC